MKSTIETVEKSVKYIQSLTCFTPFSTVSIVAFEQVNVSCETNIAVEQCKNNSGDFRWLSRLKGKLQVLSTF